MFSTLAIGALFLITPAQGQICELYIIIECEYLTRQSIGMTTYLHATGAINLEAFIGDPGSRDKALRVSMLGCNVLVALAYE